MPDEKTAAEIVEAMNALAAEVRRAHATQAENSNRYAGQLQKLSAEVADLQRRQTRNSSFVAAQRQSVSEVNSEFVQLQAAVVMQVAKIEDGARDHRAAVKAELDAINAKVDLLRSDTVGQNVELAGQTASLERQSTAITKFRNTPRATAIATFAAMFVIEIAKALWPGFFHH